MTLAALSHGDVHRLRALCIALHQRHRDVSPVALVADDEACWQVRSGLYERRLREGTAFGLLAELDGRAVGYAFCCLLDGPDDTFPVGERYADLYSLSVAEDVRGQGIGTRLLDGVDAELERRGIPALRISVLAGNEPAQRLYERRGLQVAELVLFRFGKG